MITIIKFNSDDKLREFLSILEMLRLNTIE